jgi:hypothetical protein
MCIKTKEEHECVGFEDYGKSCGHCGWAPQECCNLCGKGFEGYTRMVMPCEWKTESRKRKCETYMEICGKCDDAMVAKRLLNEFP